MNPGPVGAARDAEINAYLEKREYADLQAWKMRYAKKHGIMFDC